MLKLTLKQIRSPAEFRGQLKARAALEGRTLIQLYDEAVRAFLDRRTVHMKAVKRPPRYFAPQKTGKVLNVLLQPPLAELVSTVSEQDGTAPSCVLYTSLVSFMHPETSGYW